MNDTDANAYRALPSVDALLRSDAGKRVMASAGTERATALARGVVGRLRAEIADVRNDREGSLLQRAGELLEGDWHRLERTRQQRVINATGVVIHTNLGRSPLSRAAGDAAAEAAGRYCSIEFDLDSGKRGKRGESCERLLCDLTGAEAALVVNNCAAAAFLVLSVLAAGRDVVISRGELVEIGGDFRVPDVLAQSGAYLREVGTTNRTKISDYEKAIGENTGLLLRVHPSNYRILGFTASPELSELAELARKHGIFLYEDAGSGALLDVSRSGICGEPVISRSIEAGADIVTFSGDKLLGGPQCGIVIGRRELVERLRKHPLYRALRVDKMIYAALQATLDSYATDAAENELPTLMMLGASADQIKKRAEKLANKVRSSSGAELAVVEGASAVGGGAAPDANLPTWLIAVSGNKVSPEKLGEMLRTASPPVVARVSEDKLLIDLRTVFEEEEDLLAAALAAALSVSM